MRWGDGARIGAASFVVQEEVFCIHPPDMT
jgi:hypothetical protein